MKDTSINVLIDFLEPFHLDHINSQLYQTFRTCQARCQTLSALRELADLFGLCWGRRPALVLRFIAFVRTPNLCNNALIYCCVSQSLLNEFSEEVGL